MYISCTSPESHVFIYGRTIFKFFYYYCICMYACYVHRCVWRSEYNSVELALPLQPRGLQTVGNPTHVSMLSPAQQKPACGLIRKKGAHKLCWLQKYFQASSISPCTLSYLVLLANGLATGFLINSQYCSLLLLWPDLLVYQL